MNTGREKAVSGGRKTSISSKMIMMVVLSLIVAVVVVIAIVIPGAKSSIQTAIENNMLDLATTYGQLVDLKVQDSADETLTAEELGNVLDSAGIRGYDSSYAYVVDTEGTFLYHKKPEKIGTTVINDYVNQLLSEIPSGNYEKTGIFHYTDENGLQKYASYRVSDENQWTIVILASESDIMATLNSVRNTAVMVAVLMILVCGAISFFYSRTITNPIKKLTSMITKTAELDFTVDDGILAL